MDSPNLVDGFTSLIKPNIIPSTSYPGCAFGKMYFYFPKDEQSHRSRTNHPFIPMWSHVNCQP